MKMFEPANSPHKGCFMYFKSLQVMRGLAALSVVFYHANCYLKMIGGKSDTFFRFFDEKFSYGAWFFFVLSGFMMAYLIDTAYPRFLIRRLARIYPSFWLAAAITILAKVLVFGSVKEPKLLAGLTLLPVGAAHASYPLFIEWTLIYEVFFYAVCSAFAYGRLRNYFLHFLVAWAIVLLIGDLRFHTRTDFMPNSRQITFSLFNLLFVIGGLTYYVSKAVKGATLAGQAASLTIGIGGVVARSYFTTNAFIFSSIGLGCSGLILFGVVRDRNNASPATGQGFMEKWGDYSYGLYLIHVPVMSILLSKLHAVHRVETTGFIGILVVAAALVAGWYFGKVDLALHRHFKSLGSKARSGKPAASVSFRPMGLRLGSRKNAAASD